MVPLTASEKARQEEALRFNEERVKALIVDDNAFFHVEMHDGYPGHTRKSVEHITLGAVARRIARIVQELPKGTPIDVLVETVGLDELQMELFVGERQTLRFLAIVRSRLLGFTPYGDGVKVYMVKKGVVK